MLDLENAMAEAKAAEIEAEEEYSQGKRTSPRDAAASARRKLETFVFSKGFGKPRKTVESIPVAKNARIVEIGKTHITIAWEAPGGAVYDYEIDRQRLIYQSELARMTKIWVPHTSVKITQKGNEVIARIEELERGGRFSFRVFTHDESRGYSRSTTPFTLSTKPLGRGIPWTWIIVLTLGGVLLAMLAYQKLRNRNLGGRKIRR